MEILMTDTPEKKESRWKKFLWRCLKSPVNSLLVLALLYFGFQAYVLGHNPLINKGIMIGLVLLWLLWFIARNMLKLFLLLALAGGIAYGWYAFSQRKIAACENAGKVWNEEKQACEEKKTLTEKLERLWNKYLGTE